MPTSTKRSAPDACSLLDTDHRNVKKMFKEYEELTHSRARNEIFVKARSARGLDLMEMREQLAARKEELMEELSMTA